MVVHWVDDWAALKVVYLAALKVESTAVVWVEKTAVL